MKMIARYRTAQLLFLLIVSIFAASCGKKNIKQAPGPDTAQFVSEAVATDTGEEGAEGEGSSRNKGYSVDPALLTVYFDFDKSELGEDTRKNLRENAAALKKLAAAEVQVAGYCDERGTTEYNLALGQRRANVVRDYYKNLGISINRLSTISYGEERPACPEPTEECWSQNRRAETLIRTR